MKQNEQGLIAQALDGDEQAYAELVNRYKDGLYRHCFKFTRDEDEAEDIAQEAFIKAYLYLDRYNPKFRFSTWLYKIASNLALMHLRKRRDIRIDEDELDKVASSLPATDKLATHRELRDAVDQLPLKHRTAITMYYWQGKSYLEIAKEMGASVGAVKSWMSRAKKQLKEVLS